MLITQRQSAAVLEEGGVARRQARDLLRAGFAGAAMRAGNVCLYDRDMVADLVSWPKLSLPGLDRLCPDGVFVARRAPDLTADRATQLASVSDGWQMSPWTRLWLRTTVEDGGPLPFVATVAGFVALGADITAVGITAVDISGVGGTVPTTSFALAEPGGWFDGVRRRRVQTGPGRAWVLRGPRGFRGADARR
jgi:hypothetical protein